MAHLILAKMASGQFRMMSNSAPSQLNLIKSMSVILFEATNVDIEMPSTTSNDDDTSLDIVCPQFPSIIL